MVMFGQNPKGQMISTGNETLDKFLGGGLLNSTLNIFERQGPSSKLLDAIINKSMASTTLDAKKNLIFVNFNVLDEPTVNQLLSSLPVCRKVKTEILYKDIRGKSATAQIKIAWRYTNRNASPSDSVMRTDQVDFGLSLAKEKEQSDLGELRIINVEEPFSTERFFKELDKQLTDLKKGGNTVNIIISDLLHPFSPLNGCDNTFCKFIYALRCFSRQLDKGAIQIVYDISMLPRHSQIRQCIYNLADCVVTFYSYETDENKITGYKNIDGTLEYIKVPKINSFGLHFQRELSDWGYRLTRNHRFFVVDELSLPPCHDDEDDDQTRKPRTTNVARIDNEQQSLKQVGPLEDFREVAENVLAKRL